MNVAPTLVVANKPKCNHKSKKEKEKEAWKFKVLELAKLKTTLLGEVLNLDDEKNIRAFVEGEISPPKSSQRKYTKVEKQDFPPKGRKISLLKDNPKGSN